MARRSATECAGILDICKRIHLIKENHYSKGRELLIRVVAMLTQMAKVLGELKEKPRAGSGSGAFTTGTGVVQSPEPRIHVIYGHFIFSANFSY